MSDAPQPSHLLIYEAENGAIKVDVRFEGETVWLTQPLIAELFQTTVPNISMHLRNIFAEGELTLEGTLKQFLTVRQEGARQVSRNLEYYNLDAIISVGYRVKRIQQADAAGGEFEKAVRQLPAPPKRKKDGTP